MSCHSWVPWRGNGMKMAGSFEKRWRSRFFIIFLTQDLGLGINTTKIMENAGFNWMFFWCCGICHAPLMVKGRDCDRDPQEMDVFFSEVLWIKFWPMFSRQFRALHLSKITVKKWQAKTLELGQPILSIFLYFFPSKLPFEGNFQA